MGLRYDDIWVRRLQINRFTSKTFNNITDPNNMLPACWASLGSQM